MSYLPQTETGETQDQVKNSEGTSIRKLTESQGARSKIYEVRDATGKALPWQKTERIGRARVQTPPQSSASTIAKREHIGRLLRDCQVKSATLLDSTDPVDLALLGSSLLSILQDLWNYRAEREPDWAEVVNMLQILLSRQQF